jgi:hypothetical protein
VAGGCGNRGARPVAHLDGVVHVVLLLGVDQLQAVLGLRQVLLHPRAHVVKRSPVLG